MNILHISTSDNGGAGLAALRLHKNLLEQGVESCMLVAEKTSDLPSVFLAEKSFLNSYVPAKNKIIRKVEKILRRRGKCLSRLEQYDNYIKRLRISNPPFFTYPISCYDLSKHPLVRNADIIHLHWVENFVDYETFFPNVNKPILWTLHDLNAIYGGFHHKRLYDIFYDRYKKMEDEFFCIKRNSIINNKNISVVSLSSTMKEYITNSVLYKSKRLFEIPNFVDYDDFVNLDKIEVRKVLGLPENKTIFLFVNKWLEDSEKGLQELCQVLYELQIQNSMLVCVGDGTLPDTYDLEIKRFHGVSDMAWLNLLYNAADYLLFPSKQECFPQTTLEAMCCGTPVIMTPVSGSNEQIRDINGFRCKDFSISAFKDGIRIALSRKYDPHQIHQDVVERFAPEKIVEQYISAYRQIMSRD